jgi:hypothetical protein
MNPEKRHLISDLLDEQREARRAATLLAGGRILRQRRWRRLALRSCAVFTLVGIAAVTLQHLGLRRSPSIIASAPATPASSTAPVRSLTDAELLELFPDTPVGLVTLENGGKRLIFPRPGDEERLVKRM